MPDERQMLLPRAPVPRVSAILLSLCAHVVLFALIFRFWHTTAVHVPEQQETVQRISGAVYLPFNPAQSSATQAQVTPFRLHRSRRRASVPQPVAGAEGTALETLRQQAKQATAALVMDFKFRQIYGFSAGHKYQLAVQTDGKLPFISAADLPPKFEQYVIVEVTIDSGGRVAEARVVSGMVSTTIAQTLLSAIRDFKYNPATRDGFPIPSQLDIVIHVPS